MGYQESRRAFLSRAAVFTAGFFFFRFPEVLVQTEPFPFQKILDRYPTISSAFSVVNISFIPDNVEGVYRGFHKLDPSEAVFISVPYDAKLFAQKAAVFPGIREAITRNQPAYLVLDLPYPADADFSRQLIDWPEKARQTAEFFQGKSAVFIIGNELNIESSPWKGKMTHYLDLFCQTKQIIKNLSPQSRVFPWQEAYNQNGETLKTFLEMLSQKKEMIDGLAVNIYDISSKIQPRVEMYRRLLDSLDLAETPIIISELSMPEKPGYYSAAERTAFVIQHLVTAAYLHQEGSIEKAAWFAGFVPGGYPQHLALSTADRNNKFVWNSAFGALVLCQHLLAGDKITKNKDSNGLVRFNVWENRFLKSSFFWNEGPKPTIFDPAGDKFRLGFNSARGITEPGEKVLLSPARNAVCSVGNCAVYAA